MRSSSANCIATFRRMTDTLLPVSALAGSLSVSRQPPREACIQVTLNGTPTGTVTLSGTVNGASDTEVLTFAGGQLATSYKAFTALSGITTSISGSTTITVRALDRDGSPMTFYYDLKTGHPCTFRSGGAMNQLATRMGQLSTNRMTARVDYEDVWAPENQDVFYNEITGETFLITGVERQPDGSMAPMFWQLQLEQKEGR